MSTKKPILENELGRVVDALPGVVWTALPNGQLEFLSHRWTEYTGLAVNESLGRGWQAAVHPDDLPGLLAGWRSDSVSSAPSETQVRLSGPDGKYRWFLFRAHASTDASGKVVKWCGLATDIDQRSQSEEALRATKAEALLAGEKRLLEMVAGGRPMPETLEALCRFVESTANGSYCSIVLLDRSGSKLQEAIAPSIPAEFNDAVRGWPIERQGGPCQTVARDNVPVIMSDVASDDRWRNSWRALASKHGLRSCWSTPIVSQAGKVLGTFALYWTEPGSPNPLQLELIEQFTNIASIAIERAQRDEALRESELRSRSIIDGIPGFVAILAPNGEVEAVNRQILEYCGRPLKELKYWGTNGTIYETDLPHVVEIFSRSIAGGVPYEIEQRLRRFDGAYLWFNNRGIPVRDSTGQIVCWYVLLTDIDERKRAEQALRESEARLSEAERELRVTLNTIPVITWRGAANGYVQQINKPWFDYTGMTPEQSRGRGWKSCVHPDDVEQLIDIGNKYVASGVPIDAEARLRRYDGEYRWFLFRPAPARDESGNIVGWYGAILDIEDRKRAEEKVVEAERELQRTIDHIPVLVATYRADGSRIYVNKGTREYADRNALENWATTVHPDDIERAESKWLACIARSEPFELDFRVRMADGTYRWHLTRRVPLRDEAGKIIRWYGVGYDIEDRKRAEEKVVEAERELQRTIDHIPVLVATYRPDGSRLYVNQRVRDSTDRSAAGDSQTPPVSIHPDDAERAESKWRACVASREPFEVEHRIRMGDGTYRWHLTRRVPLRDESGNIIRWYGVGYDIEDRKRAEQKAIEAERDLQHMIDHIPAMVATYRADGLRLSINKRLRDYIGAVPSEDRQQTIQNRRTAILRIHPDDAELAETKWRESIATGEPYQHEYRVRRYDGTYRWVMRHRVPVRDETGKVIRWYGVGYEIEDRKRAEEGLRRSEALLAKAQRLSLTGSFSFNPATNEATWSEEVYRIYEVQPGTRATLAMVRSRYHPEDLHLLEEQIAKMHGGATDLDYEHRLLMPNGTIKHVHMVAQGNRAEAGGAFEYIGAVQDITQRRAAEEELRRSEAFLAKAQRLSLTGSFSYYSATGEFNWSEELYRIFEFDPGMRVSLELVATRYHPEDRYVMEEVAEGIRRELPDFDYEHRLLMPDGGIKHIRVVAHGTADKERGGIEYFGAVQDITQRRVAEQELRRSEAYLAEAQRVAHIGSWAIDYANRRPIHSSEELRRLFGFDPAAGLPSWRDWKERVHPEDQEATRETIKRSVREKTDFEMDYRVCHPDGTIKYLHVVGHPILNVAGEVVEFVGTSVDVTQRRVAEAALDKARSELARVTRAMSLGALTASIAHEVNQPLSGIITNASTCLRMLAADPPNVEGARMTAQRTIRDGNRAADVITRLRALFAKKAAATETVDLNEATREVLALVFSDILRNRVFLRTELDDDHPLLVTGDRVQLQQVILNLVRNAMEAMSEVNDRPRHLLVRADVAEDGQARLAVKDAGIGLDPQAMGRLFDAFYTTKDDGMGIGLSVSRSIIENHGGKLQAEANEGPGATFSFSIPRLAGDATAERTGADVLPPNMNDERQIMRNS